MTIAFRKISRSIHSFVQPLLPVKRNDADLVYSEEDFTFAVSTTGIKRKCDAAVKKRLSILEWVTKQDDPTFNNVVRPLALSTNVFRATVLPLISLQHISTNKGIRQASADVAKSVTACEAKVLGDKALYKAIQVICNNGDEIEELRDEDKVLLNVLVLRMRRNGAALSTRDSRRLMKYSQRATQKMSELVRDMNKRELASNSLDYKMQEFPTAAFNEYLQQREKTFSESVSQMTDQWQMLNVEPRKREYIRMASRSEKYMAILKEYTRLNRRMANILGNKSFAEYMLEAQMARTTDNAFEFLNNLNRKFRLKAREEHAQLVDLKLHDMNISNYKVYDGFYAWEKQLYIDRAHNIMSDIDEYAISIYFPLDHVLKELLGIFQNMLGLKIAEVDDSISIHSDVKKYNIYDASEDEMLGYFYLDLHKRDGKNTNGSMVPIREGFEQADGQRVHSICALVANFSSANANSPPLLKLGEVRTLVRELGHVFHFICARTKWAWFSTVHMEADATGIPSQIMEYWFKQPEVIRKIASHYATNMPMPETMIKRVCAMLNEFEALHTVEQISYSMFDLTINSSTEEKPDIEGIHRELSKEVGLLDYGGVSVCPAVVADRYAGRRCSKYYGHLWAKVFAADLFKSRFLKDGIDNAQTWMEYRKTVLEPGASSDAMAMLERFLGRKPNSDAFIEMNNLM